MGSIKLNDNPFGNILSREQVSLFRLVVRTVMFLLLGAGFFLIGFLFAVEGYAAQKKEREEVKKTRVVYPKKSEVDFDGLGIDGELNRPGEFYFEHRPKEKFDSLVKRRPNFHREMLRDAVWGR